MFTRNVGNPDILRLLIKGSLPAKATWFSIKYKEAVEKQFSLFKVSLRFGTSDPLLILKDTKF